MGWGFSHAKPVVNEVVDYFLGGSQSLSGWDGVFHFFGLGGPILEPPSRNPFQGGMGFFTRTLSCPPELGEARSQSLSGWDGVFHWSRNYLVVEVVQ